MPCSSCSSISRASWRTCARRAASSRTARSSRPSYQDGALRPADAAAPCEAGRADAMPRRDAEASREKDVEAMEPDASAGRAWRGVREEDLWDGRADVVAERLPRSEGRLKRASEPGSK